MKWTKNLENCRHLHKCQLSGMGLKMAQYNSQEVIIIKVWVDFSAISLSERQF